MGDAPNAAGQDAAGDNAAGQLNSAAPSKKRKAEAASCDKAAPEKRQQTVYHLQADGRFAALAAVGDVQHASCDGSQLMPDPDVQMLEVQQCEQGDFGDRGASSAEQEAAEVIMTLCGDVMEPQ